MRAPICAVVANAQSLPSDSAGQSSAPVSDPTDQRSAPGGDSYSASLRPPQPFLEKPAAKSSLVVPAHLQPISTRTRLSTTCSSFEETRRDEMRGRRGENVLLHRRLPPAPAAYRHRRACTPPPTPITTTVRDEMEGKGREEMKGEHVRWVRAAVGAVFRPLGAPEYKLGTALKCTCIRPHAPRLRVQSSPVTPGSSLVPRRFDMDIGIEPRARPAHRLRPRQLKEKISGRREGCERTDSPSPAPSRSRAWRLIHNDTSLFSTPGITKRAAPPPTLPLISNLPPPIPAPYTSLDTFAFIPLPPSILSPPTCTQPPPFLPSQLLLVPHPIPSHPSPSTHSVGALARWRAPALLAVGTPHGSRPPRQLLPVKVSERVGHDASRRGE
ncbi:hypothetical protein B0H14DRAFT_3853760 [Mycena olivaceomarginata]|nr:hypothetical protein B0H14DRAFT_3853760 [Mycena olivaceomarginata]